MQRGSKDGLKMINTKQNSSLKCSLLAVALGCGLSAFAQTTTTSTNFPVGLMIPDDAPSGLASSKIVSTPINYITRVKATLKLSGTWNGDLYCYLAHSSGRTVLLNRVGRRAASALGYGDEGFDVTFDDAGNDIHTYRLEVTGNQFTPISGVLTNVWAPDARTNSPYSVLDSDARSAYLSSFNGLDPNGEWVLFVADVESGDIFTLDNWGLEITGYTPPSIVSAPVDATTECTSGSATFTVSALGTAPLSYAWRFNGTPISGATSSSLTISSPTFANGGSYDVVIANNYGSLTSSVASLTVVDTTPPVITLLGNNPLYVECHSSFIDPGATAGDICAGDLTSAIVPSGIVNANVPGTYTVNYNVSDSSGNAASTVSRTVIVRDTLAPVPNLASLPDVTAQCSVTLVPPTATDACDGPITASTVDALTYSAQGDFVVHWTYTDSHGNQSGQTQNVKVHDTIRPVITLLGSSSLTVECHSGYTDAGATASDNCDGDITSHIAVNNPVNANAPGTYTVTYNVSDAVGNAAVQVSRTVVVQDTLAPVPNLASLPDVTGQCSASVTAPTATDACEGLITATTSDPLTYNAQGDFVVHWTYTDVHGNSSSQTQNVKVHDTTKPVIALLGDSSVTVECHSGYTDAGATASDNCDGDITSRISVNNPVNANVPGTYTVTYNVSDTVGNAAVQVSRTVLVQDTLAPVPDLASLPDVTGQCSASVTAPTATDACDGLITATTSDSLTYNAQGDFVVHWTYTDSHGNSSSQTQNVKVHDTIKPIITLVGNSSVTVECHTGYTDAGATASDNCDGDITSHISVGNPVDANTPGTYTVTYNVSDAVGNAAVQVSRTVIVSDSIAPVVTLNGAASMTNECHTAFTDPGATANDNCAGSVSVVTSGAVNPNAVGTYTLTYTATDPSGNVGSASRTVYVVDTIAPSIVLPANITVYTTNASGTAVNYAVTANDACSGSITPSVNPVSGSNFPIGTSTVNVSATDGSGNTSNTSFTVTVILNHAPVAQNSTLGAVENHARSLLIEKLLAKASDADGDSLTVSSVSATSTNGGSVVLTANSIIYTPATNFVGTDLFTYTVADGKDGFGSASILVTVTSENAPSLNRIGTLVVNQNGVTMTFAGIPGYSYNVQRAATPAGPWSDIGSFTVPDGGIATYTDSQPLQGSGFYRTYSAP
jgi:subtilisin-like proprotein convertase family protein/phosphoribosylformylglycinamidine (FGAM) synthase-like amidotransferase family enzyme